MSASRQSIIVCHDYKPSPDATVRALVTLLRSSVNKKAARLTPEPNGRDGTKVLEDSANVILPDQSQPT